MASVAILALGIGPTTAIFSIVEGVLLRPLPFSHPDRLVVLGDHLGDGPNISATAREIETYPSAATALSPMGPSIQTNDEISGGATSEEASAAEPAEALRSAGKGGAAPIFWNFLPKTKE